MKSGSAQPDSYTPPQPGTWDGRVDATEPRSALRWHQVVQPLDLRHPSPEWPGGGRAFGLIGYCCDAGIARNLGRPGAGAGPASIRRRLAELPVTFSPAIGLMDAGDVTCPQGPVERGQEALAALVERVHAAGLFPIILGGGHDLTFGHYLGMSRRMPPAGRLGVVSFDAHFDLRPATAGASSGTSFWQIARLCQQEQRAFDYLCLGIQRSANTVALFDSARELGVQYVLARDIIDHRLDDVRAVVDRFCGPLDAVLVTVDADVMSSAFAPGVSSPQPLGLGPETVLRLLKHVLARGPVVSFDVAEVSPRFDSDDNTAKVAAILIYALLEALIPDQERIQEA